MTTPHLPMVSAWVGDVIGGLILAGVGATLLTVSIHSYDWVNEAGIVDAGFIPGVCGVLLLALGLFLACTRAKWTICALRAARQQGEDRATPAPGSITTLRAFGVGAEPVPRGQRLAIASMFVLLVLAALGMTRIGTLPTLLGLVFFLMVISERQKLLSSAIYTVVVVGLSWLIFDTGLRVPLPGVGE